jgi:hypothetical protein
VSQQRTSPHCLSVLSSASQESIIDQLHRQHYIEQSSISITGGRPCAGDRPRGEVGRAGGSACAGSAARAGSARPAAGPPTHHRSATGPAGQRSARHARDRPGQDSTAPPTPHGGRHGPGPTPPDPESTESAAAAAAAWRRRYWRPRPRRREPGGRGGTPFRSGSRFLRRERALRFSQIHSRSACFIDKTSFKISNQVVKQSMSTRTANLLLLT